MAYAYTEYKIDPFIEITAIDFVYLITFYTKFIYPISQLDYIKLI